MKYAKICKNSNFENFESTLFSTSGSMPLNNCHFSIRPIGPRLKQTCSKTSCDVIKGNESHISKSQFQPFKQTHPICAMKYYLLVQFKPHYNQSFLSERYGQLFDFLNNVKDQNLSPLFRLPATQYYHHSSHSPWSCHIWNTLLYSKERNPNLKQNPLVLTSTIPNDSNILTQD